MPAVEAVHSMYIAHGPAIHAYAARRVGRDLADDVVADTFHQAIESYPSFVAGWGQRRDGEDSRAWLFGIATNLLRRHWRTERRRLAALARQRQTHQPGTGGDPLLVVPDRVDAATDVGHVVHALAELSHDDLELLVLVAWERLSSRDVAAILDIPPGTVRSRIHRIRQQLDASRTTQPTAGDVSAPAPSTRSVASPSSTRAVPIGEQP